MKPSFSPECFRFTIKQTSQEALLPAETNSDVLVNHSAFVRTANLEADNSDPIYASRMSCHGEVSPMGMIRPVLVNRAVG
jgi:hypothetical protein